MKLIINLFCLGCILSFLNSCTITKRHFDGGYHVEWKKNWKEEDNSLAKKEASEKDSSVAQVNSVSKSDSESNFLKEEAKSTVSESSNTEKETETLNERAITAPDKDAPISANEPVLEGSTDQSQAENDSANEQESMPYMSPTPKVETLTWVALGFFLAAVAMLFIPVGVITNPSALVLVFVLLLIIAFINAVASAIRVKRFPRNYKAKPFTWIVLFFCSIGFGFALFMLFNYLLGLS